jgi:hypothetical protein
VDCVLYVFSAVLPTQWRVIPAICMFLNVSVNPSSLGRRLIYLQFRFVIFMFHFICAMVCDSYWKTTRCRLRVKWLLLNASTVTHARWYLSLRRLITILRLL